MIAITRLFWLKLCAAAVGLLASAAEAAPAIDDGFVFVPGGVFQMGSPDSERQRNADERRHAVKIPPFLSIPARSAKSAMRK